MDVIVLVVSVALSAILAAAGVAKLLDLQGSREAVQGFGVPARLAPVAGVALPVAELATAVCLVVHDVAQAGAAIALALFLLISAGIVRALAGGEDPECHCFGQLHSAPVSTATLMRSVGLAGLSAFALAAAPGERIGDLGPAGFELLTPLLAGLAAGALARRQSAPKRRGLELPPPLPDGTPAPPFALDGANGAGGSFEQLAASGRAVVLVFVDVNCGSCPRVLRKIADWRDALASELTVAVLSRGEPEANRAMCEDYELGEVLIQRDREVADAYRVVATPGAILVDEGGTIASAPALGAPAIEALLRLALERRQLGVERASARTG